MPIDYKKYPKNWKTEIVPRILKRANNKCEICGLENHSFVTSCKIWVKTIKDFSKTVYKLKTYWVRDKSDIIRFKEFGLGIGFKKIRVVLTVAHLDHDADNHDISDDRLKALCQYCHLNYDAEMKWEKAYREG